MMVRRVKFTKQTLAQLPFGQKAVVVSDSEIPGLKLKVNPMPKRRGRHPRKTYLLEKRIKGRRGSAVTFTLGTFPNMTVDQARQKARLYANLCEQGIDPREREKQRQARISQRKVTLRELVQRFWEIHRKNLSPRTIEDYERLIRTYYGQWLGKNLCELTVDDLVEKYHLDLRRSKLGAKKAMKLLGQMCNGSPPCFARTG